MDEWAGKNAHALGDGDWVMLGIVDDGDADDEAVFAPRLVELGVTVWSRDADGGARWVSTERGKTLLALVIETGNSLDQEQQHCLRATINHWAQPLCADLFEGLQDFDLMDDDLRVTAFGRAVDRDLERRGM